MNITSNDEFLAVARHRLRHLFPRPPGQAAYRKRRHRPADTIERADRRVRAGLPGLPRPGRSPSPALITTTPTTAAGSEVRGRIFSPPQTPRAANIAPADQKNARVVLRPFPIGLSSVDTIVRDNA
jgi:hypothetical protein